jgi:hypothetical protein
MYDLKLRRLSYKAAMDVTVVRARNAGRTSLAYWSPEKGLLVAQGRQVTAPRKLLRVGMIEVGFFFFISCYLYTSSYLYACVCAGRTVGDEEARQGLGGLLRAGARCAQQHHGL